MSAARPVRSAIQTPPSSSSAGALRRLGSADWCEAAGPGHGERVLVVVSGLPGTGKSTVAAALAARLRAVQLSIDPIEDALLGAGLPPSWEVGVAAYEAARV